jgi:hypothetical protein
MGRAQNITEETVIFDQNRDGGPCSEFFVGCNPDSDNGANVFVDGIHQSGNPFPLYIQSGVVFKLLHSIRKVTVTPIAASTIIDSGIVAK